MGIRTGLLYDWALDWQMGCIDEEYLVHEMQNYIKSMGREEILSILKSHNWYVKSMNRVFEEV